MACDWCNNNKCEINGKPKGYAYCFSCGHTAQYSPEWVNKMSKKKTKRFREKQPINWTKLVLQYHNYLDKNNIPLKLSIETCHLYLVGWDGEAWTIPMFNDKFIPIGIQRRFPDSSKSCVEGSQLGLFLPGAMSYQDTKKIVICEGFSDAATATECGFYGIGYPSASYGHKFVVDFLVRASVSNVTIVSDNNSAGRKSSEKISKMLRTKLIGNRIVSVEPYKDLRNFHECKGKEETFNLLKG